MGLRKTLVSGRGITLAYLFLISQPSGSSLVLAVTCGISSNSAFISSKLVANFANAGKFKGWLIESYKGKIQL